MDTGLLSLSGVYFSYLTTLLTLHLLACLFEPGAQAARRMFSNSLCNKHWPRSPDPPASASLCWGYVYIFYIYYFLDSWFFDKVHEGLIYTIFTKKIYFSKRSIKVKLTTPMKSGFEISKFALQAKNNE